MKLVTYSYHNNVKLGAIKSDGVIDLRKRIPALPGEMIALIEKWDDVRSKVEELVEESEPDAPLDDVRLMAPVTRPGKVMAIGLNYADHIKETGQQTPKHQIWFSKAVTSINGPFDPIELPLASKMIDYEAELVVIVGKRCKHVAAECAVEVVFGYCAGNDVSVRDWQMRTPQWVLGKSFDTHAPIGPWIVTADEIGDPHTLGIRCLVNGELRQNSNTKYLVFSVFDQIAHLSTAMTLEPGDTIFTGTPGGVGLAMNPPQWLSEGDRVRVEIDQIGAIEAVMRAEATR
ncbi:MAG: fumarylacetoacetate hydrolase family protein [Candidatus Binatus sp.]|jgi:ureidoglycolate lyase|uniref:fumarylacetoacetate hydrolase family protein n=1 Tax=Candidatus Binatus sp. TaxID=2811406 RepID=UPI003CC16B45